MKPQDRARVEIDGQLAQAGWAVQDPNAVDLHASRGVAVREFPLVTGHGKADYLRFPDPPRRGASRSNDAAAGLDVMPGDPPALLAHQKRDDLGDVLRLSQPT